MLTVKANNLDASALPLLNAVFCLDCEMISDSHSDECPSCKGRSVVSLARMLGGSLFGHRAKQLRNYEGGLFDITITLDLQQMHAKEVTAMLERITNAIGPELARDGATFHINVKPTADGLNAQGSLSFLQDAA
jgi:hypothetical protein